MKKHKPINHEYLKYLADDALLSTRDVMEIFGYQNNSSITDMINNYGFPKPEIRQVGHNLKQAKTRFWTKKTVLDYIKKINEETT